MQKEDVTLELSSFRDPAGYIFSKKSKLYRMINEVGLDDYEELLSSGLYQELVNQSMLISHKEIKNNEIDKKVIQPDIVPFISYPYEWSLSQLKDAALLTLKIQKIALSHGMSLKDASAYNIQFLGSRPIFIDTLSFEKYIDGSPWKAYKQFCQHFLAPLALMHYVNVDLSKLLVMNIDGIPLDIAYKMLPKKAKLRPSITLHLGVHSRTQKKYSKETNTKERKVSKNAQIGIIENLEKLVKTFKLNISDTEWGEYYTFTNYKDKSFLQKQKLVSEYVKLAKTKNAIDLGSNNGLFSRVVAKTANVVISADIDPIAVEANYVQAKKDNDTKIIPIKYDLVNPSPNIGWANEERKNLIARLNSNDTVLALALVHHLAISNNIPLERIFELFSKMGKNLIIEFVPKEDSQVKILLSTRKDIFPNYTIAGFEKAARRYYKIVNKDNIPDTKRILYLYKKK